MLINRLAGLVLPGTTKYLLDEVIGKGNRELLIPAPLRRRRRDADPGGSPPSPSPRSSARPRSARSPRCAAECSATSAASPVGYFEQTKSGALLSRVMNDAEGIRNLVGTGLVEVVGGSGHRGARARHPLLPERQADPDRHRRPLALRAHHAVGLQDAAPALPRALQDQRRDLRPAHRVVLRRAGGEGLWRGAPRDAGLRQGRAPPVPQRRQDDHQLLG